MPAVIWKAALLSRTLVPVLSVKPVTPWVMTSTRKSVVAPTLATVSRRPPVAGAAASRGRNCSPAVTSWAERKKKSKAPFSPAWPLLTL